MAEIEQEAALIESRISYARDSYDMKFQLHGPIADLNIGGSPERIRRASIEEIFTIIEMCERQSMEKITIHPGSAVAYGDAIKPTVRELTKRSLREIDRKMKDMHVSICLENMPPASWSIGYDADELLSLIEGTAIGVCVDIGHANIAGTLDTFFREDLPISNLHLHNNRGENDQHLMIDDGSVDIQSFLTKIRAFYHGDYIIESRNIAEGILSKKRLESMMPDL